MNDTEQWRKLADTSARWWQTEDEGAVALRAAADEVDKLRARIATLEVDALRYRWLRTAKDAPFWGCLEKDGAGGHSLKYGADLDDAIDRAEKALEGSND